MSVLLFFQIVSMLGICDLTYQPSNQINWRSIENKSVIKSDFFSGEDRAAVVVILAFYNGNKFLTEQIRSILDQKKVRKLIFISDDNSEEKVKIDNSVFSKQERSKIFTGRQDTNLGYTKNFLSALRNAPAESPYYSFSDQDDIWYPDKLSRAVNFLANTPSEVPALYVSRTAIADDRCQTITGTSPLFLKEPSFANSLAQCIGGGNTMVFNKAARDLIVLTTETTDVVAHDWWCYQIISGVGGKIYYDSRPSLKYRQHSENVAGSNLFWQAKISRFSDALSGKFKDWNKRNLLALMSNRDLLTNENRRCLQEFVTARESRFLKRFFYFLRSGVHRQKFIENLGLFFCVLLNRI